MLGRELSQSQKFLMLKVVAHEMGLDIENELSGQALLARPHQLGLVRFGRRDLEYVGTIDFVHGYKGGSHATACLHEPPTAQAESSAIDVGQLQNSSLDALLRLALRRWKIFAVRYNLGGYRSCGRSRFSARDKTLFSFAEPTTHSCLPSITASKKA